MIPAAVLFDCDGVVVDSEAIAFDMLEQDLTQHGLPVAVTDLHKLFLGGTVRGLFETARQMGATLADDWPDTFYERLYARLRLGVDLVAGIEGVLAALDRAKIPFAMGSNGSGEKMQITLCQHPAVHQQFAGRMFSAQDIGAPKPLPDIYLYGAKMLGVNATDCVVIEDSSTGARAAAAAGMRCYGFAPKASDTAERLAAAGAHLFHDMRDLPGLLGIPNA